MTGQACAALALLAAAGAAWAPPARAADALAVCLDANIPPLSSKHGREADGFDLALAQKVATRLGRSLAVQWFESKADPDSHPALEANALLSDGRCQLVAGYPLLADAVGAPAAKRSRLPDFEGARPEDRRRWVKLGTLVPTRGYRFAPMTVVLGPEIADRKIRRLADLKGVKLGVEEHTLPDAILMSYGGGELIDQITHVVLGAALFERMERNEYAATLVELHRFDAYRARHPESRLVPSGYYHSIGFNMGFVGLSSEAALIAEADDALGQMLANDELPALAQAAGLTYLPPRAPDIRAAIPLAALRGD